MNRCRPIVIPRLRLRARITSVKLQIVSNFASTKLSTRGHGASREEEPRVRAPVPPSPPTPQPTAAARTHFVLCHAHPMPKLVWTKSISPCRCLIVTGALRSPVAVLSKLPRPCHHLQGRCRADAYDPKHRSLPMMLSRCPTGIQQHVHLHVRSPNATCQPTSRFLPRRLGRQT